MALDADALAALADFGKNLPGDPEGESGGEDKSAAAPEFGVAAEDDSASNADTSSESIPPAWESFPSDLEVVTALLAAVSAETGEKQESLLPQTKLIDDLDFDDLSLYAVVAQLEAVLKEKRSDNEIAECKSLGEMALLYVSSNKRTN
ncbi:phosphopantetheine-binding protein [Varibaculum cambriense]|uniref:phosphopantetheine-binding protein n=1 Tax=Varibaculum cambriense TaxID=184870 RepID=UPI0039F450A3